MSTVKYPVQLDAQKQTYVRSRSVLNVLLVLFGNFMRNRLPSLGYHIALNNVQREIKLSEGTRKEEVLTSALNVLTCGVYPAWFISLGDRPFGEATEAIRVLKNIKEGLEKANNLKEENLFDGTIPTLTTYKIGCDEAKCWEDTLQAFISMHDITLKKFNQILIDAAYAVHLTGVEKEKAEELSKAHGVSIDAIPAHIDEVEPLVYDDFFSPEGFLKVEDNITDLLGVFSIEQTILIAGIQSYLNDNDKGTLVPFEANQEMNENYTALSALIIEQKMQFDFVNAERLSSYKKSREKWENFKSMVDFLEKSDLRKKEDARDILDLLEELDNEN